jgi:hypothetical protein
MGSPDSAVRATLPSLLIASLVALSPTWAQSQSDGANPPPGQSGGSIEAAGGTVVLPPLPIEPAELLAEDRRAARSALLLTRIEVLDTFVARFARQTRRLVAGADVDCDAVGALDHALRLALDGSGLAERTVRADLAVLPPDPSLDPMRERATQASARRRDVQERLWPALVRDVQARCPAVDGFADAPPTPWLPEDDRRAADGHALIFVKAARPGDVVWLDGRPAGVADAGGWAAVVAPDRAVRLCQARPGADSCDELVEVMAAPAAAFDLSR